MCVCVCVCLSVCVWGGGVSVCARAHEGMCRFVLNYILYIQHIHVTHIGVVFRCKAHIGLRVGAVEIYQ